MGRQPKFSLNKLGQYEADFRWLRDQPTKEKRAGYCHNKSHKGYLSVKMIKKHECLRKQCPFLEKYEDHEYWKQRERIKLKKKENKKKGN